MSIFTNIIDTHAHYDDKQFDEVRNTLLPQIHENGVAHIINCSSSLESMQKTIDLAEKYDFISPALGLHPLDISELNQEKVLSALKDNLIAHKAVAVGEIGLDYYYKDIAPRSVQQDWFEKQILLAKELDLPVIVHDRESHQDVFDLLKKHKPKGVLHCYSGSAEMAIEYIKLGFYIGIGGTVTFKNARRVVEVVQSIPIEYLLLETDAPYLAPVPMRGKRNQSDYIAYTAQHIANLLNIDTQSFINQTSKNAQKLFKY